MASLSNKASGTAIPYARDYNTIRPSGNTLVLEVSLQPSTILKPGGSDSQSPDAVEDSSLLSPRTCEACEETL